jgi:uncharacterized membrane protein (DUF106 family)
MAFYDPIVNGANALFNFLFLWAVNVDPLFGIFLVAAILSLISVVSWKYLTDQTLLKDLRERTKKMQAQIKEHRGNPDKMKEINSKMGKDQMQAIKLQYKQSIKPMMVTLIPFAFVYVWIRNTYEPFGDILFSFGGVGTYIIFTIVLSMVLRKIMKVY